MKTILTLAAIALTLGHATANYADSPNIRVDTLGRNLVSLSVVPADQPAPAASSAGEVMPTTGQSTALMTLPSGGTMQFQAWALYDGGSSEDVTAQAKWSAGSGLPRSTSIDQGLLKLGVTGYQLTGTVQASFSAGTHSEISSCRFTVFPGPQIDVSAVVEVVNYRYRISATAHVVGNQQPVNSDDFEWDLDGDEFYGESGETTSVVTKEVTLKSNCLLRVKIWADGKLVSRSFIVEVNQAPVIGQPVTLPVQDITVDGLKVWNGSSLVLGGLASGKSGLAVVIHGLEDSTDLTRSPWVSNLCGAIQQRVEQVNSVNVAAWDWRLMADPTLYLRSTTVRNDLISLLKGVPEFIGDMLVDLLIIRKNGEANGVLLAERLFAEEATGRITKSTPIHLIGHSAGGFVAGECAKRLKWMGFSNLQVTMLDTPIPFASHANSSWRTERYISGFFGGRFETEPGTSKKLSDLYNSAAWIMGDRMEIIDCTTNSYEPYMGYSQSTAAVLMTTFEARGVSGVPEGANYRRVEIQHPGLPSGPMGRHSYAYEWYGASVNSTMPGGEGGFAYSNLLGSAPFPLSSPAPAGEVALMVALAESPPPPVDLDGFTYFGTVSGAGGVHTLTENTDAGMWKDFTLPIGSQTLRFRYQFTTPGDGDYLAAYWGEEAVLVICPDMASARAGFVEMEADVSRFGGQQGNLVFKLVSRGEVNAVAQIDQVQIVLSDDPDDDGLTNAQEATYGSNPHSDDSDGDGLSDYDEVTTHGTSPTVADSDGDMLPDQAELAVSTNPLDKNSFLRPRMERGATGQPELLWQGVSGRTYSVVRSLDLTGTAFDFIRTQVPGNGVDCSVVDPDTSVNPRAFYWVVPE